MDINTVIVLFIYINCSIYIYVASYYNHAIYHNNIIN